MRNNILLVLIASSLFFFSCGTMSRTAQNGQTGFTNSIYYSPDKGEELAYNQSKEELAQVQNETTSFLDGRNQTIYVGDTNVVTIDYNPEYTYSIVDNDESYEARLRKFDSPVYTVNIEWNSPYNYDWYNWNSWHTYGYWGWHNPWYRHSCWHNPWYYGYGYAWHSPYYGWYDPWYYGYGHGWYDPWYYGYGYGWYDPWWGHGWNPAPFPSHNHPHRDIYYGHRGSSPSYNTTAGRGGSSYTRNMGNVSQIRGNGTKGNSAAVNGTHSAGRSGSAYRRTGNNHNGAIYNNAAANAGNRQQNTVKSHNSQSASGRPSQGSMYRRSATQNTRNVSVSTSNTQSEQNSNGYRSNSNYNNSSNSYRNSSYNRGNSSNSYGSGAPTRSSGSSSGSYNSQRSSGSSYRR